MSERTRLTKRVVDALKPDGPKEAFAWDSEAPGFGVRAYPSGRKIFVAKYRTPAGRQRWHKLGPFGVLTVEQARTEARDVLERVRRGVDPSAERAAKRRAPCVKDLAQRFLDEHAVPHKKASSVVSDRDLLRLYILPRLGASAVADVTRDDLAALHRAIGCDSEARRGTPTTANRVLFLCSTMFNFAERWGWRAAHSNPTRHVPRFKEVRRERYLSPAELGRLGQTLAACASSELPSVIAAIRLLLFTGCRRGEVLGLRWEDVDFERNMLRLSDTKTGPRVVRLNAPALEVLADLRERRGASPWVIVGGIEGKPLVGLPHAWQRIRRRAGLDEVRLHDLRHGFGSAAVSGGASLYVTGALLGHRNLDTTQRYAHLADDPLRAASEAVGARIAAALNGAPGADVVPLRRGA